MDDSYIEYMQSEQVPTHQQAPQSEEETVRATSKSTRYFSLKVHGNKAAIEIKADTTRNSFQTIRIESAVIASQNNEKPKRYDWGNKIQIQLTKTDLLDFIASMLLIQESSEFKHYGERNDKSASFKFQTNDTQKKIFAQIGQKSKPLMGIPISLNDAIQIGHMALNQYCKNFPNVTSDSVIQTLNRLASLKYKT
ncbi:hypothetical protein ACMAZF_20110 (plasmid) [Psychrobium sp. nBUS_13]|uniref:hypothetical protein n=1 Tax=Psychrobium sp. nBUS_13 TaxID=3395319 RepID=UPI003EB8AE47